MLKSPFHRVFPLRFSLTFPYSFVLDISRKFIGRSSEPLDINGDFFFLVFAKAKNKFATANFKNA